MIMHPEAQALLRDMACRLLRIADKGPSGIRAVQLVITRYHVALADDPDPHIREQRRRDFLIALRAFVALYHTRQSPDLTILKSILDKNKDLHAIA